MVNKVKENITIQIQMYIKDSGLMIWNMDMARCTTPMVKAMMGIGAEERNMDKELTSILMELSFEEILILEKNKVLEQ